MSTTDARVQAVMSVLDDIIDGYYAPIFEEKVIEALAAADAAQNLEAAARTLLWETSMGCVDFEGEPAAQAMDVARKVLAAAAAPPAERPKHTQECEDHAFCVHAATGGDADCICGAMP